MRAPLAQAELERMRTELDGVAAELAACRERYHAPGRQPIARDVGAALRTYRRLHDRIAAVLAGLAEAGEPRSG